LAQAACANKKHGVGSLGLFCKMGEGGGVAS
jgi:hypothetical protein